MNTPIRPISQTLNPVRESDPARPLVPDDPVPDDPVPLLPELLLPELELEPEPDPDVPLPDCANADADANARIRTPKAAPSASVRRSEPTIKTSPREVGGIEALFYPPKRQPWLTWGCADLTPC
jgi:hypothetical protein